MKSGGSSITLGGGALKVGYKSTWGEVLVSRICIFLAKLAGLLTFLAFEMFAEGCVSMRVKASTSG